MNIIIIDIDNEIDMNIYTHTSVQIHTHTNTNTHTSAHTHTHTATHTQIHSSAHTYIHGRLHTLHTNTYKHIQTHTLTHTLTFLHTGQDVENDSGNETISGENVDICSSAVYRPLKLSSELDCLDIDQFIAAMCVPPPPQHCNAPGTTNQPPPCQEKLNCEVVEEEEEEVFSNATSTSSSSNPNSEPTRPNSTSPTAVHSSPVLAEKPPITRAKPILKPLPIGSSSPHRAPCSDIPAVVETDSAVPLWKQLLTPVTSPSHAPLLPLSSASSSPSHVMHEDGKNEDDLVMRCNGVLNTMEAGVKGHQFVSQPINDVISTVNNTSDAELQRTRGVGDGASLPTGSTIVAERLAALNHSRTSESSTSRDVKIFNGSSNQRVNGTPANDPSSRLNFSFNNDTSAGRLDSNCSSAGTRLNSCANDSGIQSRNRSETSEGDALPLTPEELALLQATPPFLVTPSSTTVVYDTPTTETKVVMRRKNSPPITPTHYSAIMNAYAAPTQDSCQTLSRRTMPQSKTPVDSPNYSTLPHPARNHHSTSALPPPPEEHPYREPRGRTKGPVPPRRYSSLECDQIRPQHQKSASNSSRHAPSTNSAHKPAPPPRRGSKLLRDSDIIYDKPQVLY